jgi:hypothetical protein
VEHRAVAMVEPAMRRKGWSTGWLGMDEPGLEFPVWLASVHPRGDKKM